MRIRDLIAVLFVLGATVLGIILMSALNDEASPATIADQLMR
jgi:hypothetical protein